MKRVFSMLCVLALMLGMLAVPAYATDAESVPANENIVLSENAENLTVEEDTYIDLNGHNIAGVTVKDGATLYVSDSQTDDYTVADGIYGKITDAEGNVQADEGYVAITEEDTVSYHKVDLTLTSMTLRPAAAGVYYNSAFAADEVVAANVECYGVALSVVAEPTAENLDTLCGYSTIYGFEAGEKSGTLLTGIMNDGNTDFANDRNAAMNIYGRAYIKTAEGYTFGTTASRNLKEQVEAIDAIFSQLNEAQSTAILSMYSQFQSVMENWNVPNMKHAAPVGDTVITVPVETEDGEVTETVTVEQDGVSITIPFGTLVESNELTLTVTRLDASESEIEAGEGQTLMPFDVHVDGIAAENTQPLTVALGKVMPENLNMGNYTVYHVEEDGTSEMELVASAEDLTDHNQYAYTLDGELTLNMASFSEVPVVYDNTAKWEGGVNHEWYDANAETLYIRNADQLWSLSQIVGGMEGCNQDSFDGKTIVLLSDINLDDGEEDNDPNKIFYPIGYNSNDGTYKKTGVAVSTGFYAFKGTFDGNGNTISNFYQNTWEMKGDHNWYDATLQYYRDGMGLFGKVYGGTVKNLTVDNFSCDGEIATTGVIAAYADCGATFENIAITNCNPRVYNIGNGGIVGCAGWYAKESTAATETEEAKPITFKNITVDQSNKISALWGTYDVSCGGILGQYYPVSGQDDGYQNGGIHFENCHVAAVMDVYNDVCANYQYYWYRYSGMFIGTVRANVKEGNYTVADTTGITATKCTYTYGEWNQYWYCELVKNSLASYTHDHQFSRLTTISSLSEIQDENGKWNTEGNFVIPNEDNTAATCYHIFKNSEGNLYQHFHDKPDETNPEVYETINGVKMLKEDRQCYFMPFNQVMNGLGYGVKAHYDFEEHKTIDIKLATNSAVKAEEKFDSLDTVTTYRPGQTITLGQLVSSKVDETKLSKASIYASVSPVTETGIASATYSLDMSDWTKSTLQFATDCADSVKIVITDYFYCKPLTITLDLEQAAPKFIANEILEKNAYTQITLGTLFGVEDGKTIGNVTATVTDPNGKSTTYTPTDWAAQTIDLTKDGTWTVVIKDDDAYCAVTETTFTVNKADKFTKKFDKDFLYRIGNANTAEIGYLFGETETAVKLSAVNVTIENVAGDAAGTFTSNATWTSGTLEFTGTGVVKVTISADGAESKTLNLEVVDATNLTSATGTTTGGAFVLMKDVNASSYVNYWNATIYGNGFTYSLNGAPTAYNSKQGHGVLVLKNATLDNMVIIGDVYDSYGAYTNQDYYNAAIDCNPENTDTVIRNCYIANCAAPVKTRGGNVTIENTTLYGGTVANLIINSGTVTLNDVTTANFDDGRKLVGMGIVFHSDATENAKLILDGTLKQYNFMSEEKVPTDTYAKQIHSAMFGTNCEKYHFGTSPNRYVNAGIVSMSNAVTIEKVEDKAITGYAHTEVTLGDKDGFVYSQLKTVGTVDNDYDFGSDVHVATAYGAVEPAYEFDYTVKNYKAKEEGNNDFCYEENNTVYISMDDGDTFNWDTSILTAEKAGNTLGYTVSMDGTDYTGRSITFNTAGDYTVTYSYTDPYNYRFDANGNITTYSAPYQKTVKISVAVIEAATKHAEFTFGSSNTASTTVVVGTKTYVMPDVTGTSSTIGSTTVDGKTIYYPIVDIIMSDGKTDHTSGWYAYFPVFSGAVTITDYKDKGLGDAEIFDAATTEMPNGLSLGDAASAASVFKYQSGTATDTIPEVKNNKLVYSSAIIEANRNEYNGLVQYCYEDNAGTPFYYYIGYHAPKQTYTNGCVTPDTLVTMADGSKKEIQYVTDADKLLVWDFVNGEYTTMPSAIIFNHGWDNHRVLTLKFSDGTTIKTINGHDFFDADINQFVTIDEFNVADYVGHAFIKENGLLQQVVLQDYVVEVEYTAAYSILTAIHYNCFLENMLTLSPNPIGGNFFMPFEVGADMKFDAEKMQKDIETYGLFSYEEFAHLATAEQFYALNGPQIKVAVGKGIITMEQLYLIIAAFLPENS